MSDTPPKVVSGFGAGETDEVEQAREKRAFLLANPAASTPAPTAPQPAPATPAMAPVSAPAGGSE